MFAPDRPSWQNPRILVLLLLVFVCGALAGAVMMRYGIHEKMHRSTSSSAYWRDDKTQFFSYDKLRKDLDLTPDQSQRLKTILDDFAKYHEDLETQMEDVRATGKNRIVQMLTPAQRQRFEQLCNQLRIQ